MDSKQRSNKTFFKKLKYSFDNSMSKSGAFVAYLALIALILALLMTGLRYVIEKTDMSFLDRFWDSLSKILRIGRGKNWSQRILSILFWMMSVAVSGTVIGFITNAIRQIISNLKKGKSEILDSNHILILGWSDRVFSILKELKIANESEKNALVVIFANTDREKMEDAISDRTGELGKLKIVTRYGNPASTNDLERTNLSAAKAVIILDENDRNDAAVVSTILAVMSVNKNPNLTVIAEIDDPNHADTLENIYKGQVKCINSKMVTAKVAAQSGRQAGLASVIVDFMDFEGDEIYFTEIPELVGKKYSETLFCFEASCVIGYVDSKNKPHLNPPQDTLIEKGYKIITVSEDDSTVKYKPFDRNFTNLTLPEKEIYKPKAEHFLFLGWSYMGDAIFKEIQPFLPPGSTIDILAIQKYIDFNDFPLGEYENVEYSQKYYTGNIQSLKEIIAGKKYDEITILGYRSGIAQDAADTHTIITLLQLNEIFAQLNFKIEKTRIVTEILDSSKAVLASGINHGELVLSDNLAALLISQLAENPGLSDVFADVFSPEGRTISLLPIELYANEGSELDFYDLTYLASLKGESAIGYRKAAISKEQPAIVELNPVKSNKIKISKGDSLIVVKNT